MTVRFAALAALALTACSLPRQRAATDLTVDRSPERVARGEYLVNHVTPCGLCHSRTDRLTFPQAPLDAPLSGGDCWDAREGFPGQICGSNLTSHPVEGLGSWTDDQILRAIREGVDRDGKALFPVMLYQEFRHLSDDDAHAIVAYLRTLPPSDRPSGARELDFPLNVLVRTFPEPLTEAVAGPDPNDAVARGAYLARVAGCQSCHTPVDDSHEPIPGREFAGGQVMVNRTRTVVSQNLTPHPTGLGGWTREAFVQRFKGLEGREPQPIQADAYSEMPWTSYAGMSEEDLSAIYAFLRTLPPIDNAVVTRP